MFNPGEVIKLPLSELPHVANDLGKALQPMEWSEEFSKFRPVEMSELDVPSMVEMVQTAIKDGTIADLEREDELEELTKPEK